MSAEKILKPVILVLVVYIAFTIGLLRFFDWDVSCMVHVGRTFNEPSELPEGMCVPDEGLGYDSQFYYRFALSPFSNEAREHGIGLDIPRYRHQRILYPLVVGALSAGQPALVPYMMLLVNLAAIGGLTALAAIYALSHGRSAYMSLVVGLYSGFLLSYALNLAEILECLLLAAAFLLLRTRPHWAALLLAGAILTRETALLFAASVLAVAFWQRWQHWYVYLFPIGVYGAWQAFLAWFWRDYPRTFIQESVGLPFVGYLSELVDRFQSASWFAFSILLIVGLIGLLMLAALPKSSAPLYVKLAWLLYSALAISLTTQVWVQYNGYLRGLSEWYLLGLVILFHHKFFETRPAARQVV